MDSYLEQMDARISSLLEKYGMQEKDVADMLEDFALPFGDAREMISGMVEDLKALAPVIQGAVENIDNWKDSPLLLSSSSSSSSASLPSKRQLQEESTHFSKEHLNPFMESSSNNRNPTSSSSSSSTRNSNRQDEFTGTSYYSQEHLKKVFADPSNLDGKLMNVLSGKDFNPRSFLATFAGSSGTGTGRGGWRQHHHHRHTPHSSSQQRRYGGRRIQSSVQAEDTCDGGCDDYPDANSRLTCNCADLVDCARGLKVNDYAVMFARGLLRDEETGIIDPEQVFDIFDANDLLGKISDISGVLAAIDSNGPNENDCSALLEQFHVPCRDWEDGCASSSGSSYPLVRL
jgi:hypothetical protein